jgi:hypothetical protein
VIAKAIEKIQQLATSGLVFGPPSARQIILSDADGNESLVDTASPKATVETIELTTLDSLSEYIKSDFDGTKDAGIFVFGPDIVQLHSKIFGDFRQRETFLTVEPYVSEGFPYGQYIDIELFVTAMQSHFVQNKSVASVLSVVGNIQTELVQTSVDDGVSQTVTARSGIAKVAAVPVPNPVPLRPFRTFPEIEQPESNFVLRIKRIDGKLPLVALFETGDNQWKVEAIEKIGDYLRDQDLGVPIFA